MLHLVVWLAILQVCEVGNISTCFTKQVAIHSRESVIEHVPGLNIVLGCH